MGLAFVMNSYTLLPTIANIVNPFITETLRSIDTTIKGILGMQVFWDTLFRNENVNNCLAIGPPNTLFDVLIDVSKNLLLNGKIFIKHCQIVLINLLTDGCME